MTTPIAYRSYAKLNLFFEILKRRRDGYHDIETIFQTVELGDDLLFHERTARLYLSCSSKEIDSGDENLIIKAATLLKREYGCRKGCLIELEKRIPVSAGLAGGSGNAAATLVALSQLWGLGLSAARIAKHALELGSDVPYCCVGGTVAATGRGERLTPLEPLGDKWFVLLHPRIAVSTRRIYNHQDLGRSGEEPFAGKTRAFRRAIEALEAEDYPAAIFNRMEEIVFREQPRLAALRERLLEGGCLAAAMSGSGSTLFGICASRREANRAARGFENTKVSVVRSVGMGIERNH